jgi:hypothetical protein
MDGAATQPPPPLAVSSLVECSILKYDPWNSYGNYIKLPYRTSMSRIINHQAGGFRVYTRKDIKGHQINKKIAYPNAINSIKVHYIYQYSL